MVITSLAHAPETPDGNPEKLAPVAPVVTYLMLLMGWSKNMVWALVPADEDKLIVLSTYAVFTATVPTELIVVPQDPLVTNTLYFVVLVIPV